MRLAWILLAFALTACGTSPSPTAVTVEPALAPYLASFESDVGASTAGISAVFADTETQANPLGETVGECMTWTDQDGKIVARTIQVDTAYWATIPDYVRKELMYHELGHCALNLQHITTSKGDGCPSSIMYPYVFSDCFENQMPYYFGELSSHR